MAHIGDFAGATATRPGSSTVKDRPVPPSRTDLRPPPSVADRITATIVALLVLAHVVGFAIAEPLRKAAERRMNEALTGYSVKIGGLRLNIFGLGVDLLDVVVVQTAHPKPAVARLPRFGASIQWGALLSGKVVGDLELDSPHVFLNLTQARAEVAGPQEA